MGLDDRNEGDGPGECVEHVWKMTAATFDRAGAFLEYRCLRCPATTAEQPEG